MCIGGLHQRRRRHGEAARRDPGKFALQLDDHGSGVEVYPVGTELQPAGEEGGSFVRKPREGRGFGATHFALSVAADAGKVKQIAERAGWHCVTWKAAMQTRAGRLYQAAYEVEVIKPRPRNGG
jgi:hypothetical protein